MPTFEANGVKMNYTRLECESSGGCEDLVMIHGLAANMAYWYYPHAVKFARRRRITLFDMRGHGRSTITPNGYTPDNLSLDLRQLLDHLGIGRAHFIAHSYGGIVALKLACQEPHRFASLALVDTHISAVRGLSKINDTEFGRKIQGFLSQHGIEIDAAQPYFGFKLLSAVARLHRNNVALPQEMQAIIKPVVGNLSKRPVIQWLNLMEKTDAEAELMSDDGLSLEKLRQLQFPILAVYGENSQAMSTGKQLLKVWPHADFRQIRGAGHFFPRTRPTEFITICSKFWQAARPFRVLRKNEPSAQNYFRSGRFYRKDGQWFFDTREAKQEGPFADINEAKRNLYERFPMLKVAKAS